MTRITTAIFLLLLFAAGASAQTDRRIEAINTLRAKIDKDIAASEAEPEYSNIYLTELAVNKNNGSYPAVGVYRPVAKFYYTYGDREKEPYPNRLLKIVLAIDRSDRKEPRNLFSMTPSNWFSISGRWKASSVVSLSLRAGR